MIPTTKNQLSWSSFIIHSVPYIPPAWITLLLSYYRGAAMNAMLHYSVPKKHTTLQCN
jgi:hypothetical protein